MIFHHSLSPEIFRLGPLALRWYGLFYVTGLVLAYLLSERELFRQGLLKKGEEGKLLYAILIGVIAGARVGYCVLYNLPFYLEHPLEVFSIWEGGLSFHGGLAGVLLAVWFLSARTLQGFYAWGDVFARFAPIGLGLGRLGNFMNSELIGRPTNGAWGVVFDRVDPAVRHPSQLYEALLEGAVLFFLMFLIHRKTQKKGVCFWSFIAFYGLFRLGVEWFREPDPQVGYLFAHLTLGQWLSIPMIAFAFGAVFWIIGKGKHLPEVEKRLKKPMACLPGRVWGQPPADGGGLSPESNLRRGPKRRLKPSLPFSLKENVFYRFGSLILRSSASWACSS